jgi:glutathione S-transferase
VTTRALRETAQAKERFKVPAKLHYASASPFVRKVMASAIELDLDEHLALEPAANPTLPTVRNPAIAADNPLSKVPTLVLADGERLFDSIVICEYLDAVDGQHRLFPSSGMARWRALRTNALADGILEAGVSVRLERLRPEDKRWSEWIDGHLFKIDGSLDLLEHSFDSWSSGLNIGHIALSCALQWLEFREIVENPRKGRDRLYAWHEEFLKRPSMARTKPA